MTARAPRVRVTTPTSATAVRRVAEAQAYAARRFAESLEEAAAFLAEQVERRREREQEHARFLARRRLGAHLHFEAPEGRVVDALSGTAGPDRRVVTVLPADWFGPSDGAPGVWAKVPRYFIDRSARPGWVLPAAALELVDARVEVLYLVQDDAEGAGQFVDLQGEPVRCVARAGDPHRGEDVCGCGRDGADVREPLARDEQVAHGSSPSVGRAAGGTSRVSGPPAAAPTAPGDGVPTVGEGSDTAAVPPSAAVSENTERSAS